MRAPRTIPVVVLVVLGWMAACYDATGPAEPITELPRPLSALESEIVGASNTFGFELAGELLPTAPDSNLFFSPLSASMLLGMLMNGADGNTWTQMQEVLGFEGMSEEQINQGYADLTDLILGLDPSVTTEIGNSVWPKAGFPVIPDFQDRVLRYFGAEAREMDLDAINAWARDATSGRIETIFDELPGNAVMVLLNAIYFKANWTTQFDRSQTEPADFTRPDGSQVTVDMMNLEAELPSTSTDQATLVDLPYGGGAFTMTVVVPHEGVEVNDMVAGLTGERWSDWIAELREGRTDLYLPRMEIEWEAELNEMLKALGMTDAFGPADFSRLTPGGGIWLGVVKQKSFVKVDEAGTEAAAVTGAMLLESGPRTVRADRPFLFVLRERFTGTVLFMGVINDPSG